MVTVKISHQERGRKGGITTRERYGQEYYQRIGKQGGKARKKSKSSIDAKLITKP